MSVHFKKRFTVSATYLFALLGPCLSTGCGASASPAVVAPDAPVVAEPERRPRPELTVEEAALRERLAAHVAALAKIGERNLAHDWELMDAAEYVNEQFESMGYVVEKEGYEVGGEAMVNLIAHKKGGERGDQIIVVGAHYDTPHAGSGRNTGTTGVAAVLELARLIGSSDLKRSVRFVAFGLGESPDGDGAARGSRVSAQKMRARFNAARDALLRHQKSIEEGAIPPNYPPPEAELSRPVAMIALSRLGSFRAQATFADPVHPREVLVHVDAVPEAGTFAFALTEALEGDPMRLSMTTAPGLSETSPETDAGAFAEAQVPSVSISGDGQDAPLDLDAMARVVMALRGGIGRMAAEKHQLDRLLLPNDVGDGDPERAAE